MKIGGFPNRWAATRVLSLYWSKLICTPSCAMRVRGGSFVIAALALSFEDGKANLKYCCRPKPRRRTAVWCSSYEREGDIIWEKTARGARGHRKWCVQRAAGSWQYHYRVCEGIKRSLQLYLWSPSRPRTGRSVGAQCLLKLMEPYRPLLDLHDEFLGIVRRGRSIRLK